MVTPSQKAMKPSKPFLLTLSALAVAGAAVASTVPATPAAAAAESMPLSTALTPVMIDYFGLGDAFVRPSISNLLECHARPACGSSDSSTVRFIDPSGQRLASYDSAPGSVIETQRRQESSPSAGITETRVLVRRYQRDDQGRIVMNGVDSIVRIEVGAANRAASTLTRVHRYSDMRYLANSLTFVWPMTGLVVLELSNAVEAAQRAPLRLAAHGAVSFDGTRYAQILTTGGLTHRVDLSAKRLETTMPDR